MSDDVAGPSALRSPPIAAKRIAELETVSSEHRLRLLTLLAEGVPLDEVREASDRSAEEIERDLDQLRRAGLVKRHRSRPRDLSGSRRSDRDQPGERDRDRGIDRAFVPDLAPLYELGEVLRGLSIAYGHSPVEPDPPVTWQPPTSEVPTLTVVHGTTIGRSFRLGTDSVSSRRGWIIGRGNGVDVPLDEDPYVEPEAGEIEPWEGRLELVDLRTADRRVSLNGQTLGRGERREISDGDLVGVGRSLLRFRA